MMMNSGKKQLAVLLPVTLITIAACGLFLILHKESGIAQPISFSLVNHHEREVTEAQLEGKWSLVSFGFINCVDVCPVQVASLKRLTTGLKAKGLNVSPYFVSVDPENDTPERLEKYIASFNTEIIGLTGTKSQISKAISEFNVFSSNFVGEDGRAITDHNSMNKMEHSEGDYDTHSKEVKAVEIVHSTSFYLVDPKLNIKSFYSPTAVTSETVNKIVLAINLEES